MKVAEIDQVKCEIARNRYPNKVKLVNLLWNRSIYALTIFSQLKWWISPRTLTSLPPKVHFKVQHFHIFPIQHSHSLSHINFPSIFQSFSTIFKTSQSTWLTIINPRTDLKSAKNMSKFHLNFPATFTPAQLILKTWTRWRENGKIFVIWQTIFLFRGKKASERESWARHFTFRWPFTLWHVQRYHKRCEWERQRDAK